MAKILGIIWLILGIIWLIKPEVLKNRLKRKMNRKIRFTVYGSLIIIGIFMIGSILKAPGLIPKIIGVLGAVLIVKAVLLLLSKASEKMWEWWAGQPLIFFRLQAIVFIVIGLMLISV